MLYQLSYQANWELVIVWVHDKLVDNGYIMGGVGGGQVWPSGWQQTS